MTTPVLNTKITEVENKIPDTSSLVTTIVLNTKISEAENTISDNSNYVISQEFNKLTAEHLAAGLNQADLVSKTDFDNNLISILYCFLA